MTQSQTNSLALKAAAIVAVLFGLLTIFSGGRALFGGAEARAAVGNAVPFVLWFNFAAGFAYVIAGAGLMARQSWAVWLSAMIVLSTAAIFAVFGLHVVQGGAYEMRTVGAMTLRTAVWLAITMIAMRKIGWK
jgi:hypothetical protein